MNLENLLDFYKTYSKKHELKTYHHRTHISMMMSRISDLLTWCSKSKNKDLNRYTDLVQNASSLFESLENFSNNIDEDDSKIFQPKGTVPNLLIKQLVDILIHILIYIAGNDWKDKFIKELFKTVSRDEAESYFKISRFKNKRLL